MYSHASRRLSNDTAIWFLINVERRIDPSDFLVRVGAEKLKLWFILVTSILDDNEILHLHFLSLSIDQLNIIIFVKNGLAL